MPRSVRPVPSAFKSVPKRGRRDTHRLERAAGIPTNTSGRWIPEAPHVLPGCHGNALMSPVRGERGAGAAAARPGWRRGGEAGKGRGGFSVPWLCGLPSWFLWCLRDTGTFSKKKKTKKPGDFESYQGNLEGLLKYTSLISSPVEQSPALAAVGAVPRNSPSPFLLFPQISELALVASWFAFFDKLPFSSAQNSQVLSGTVTSCSGIEIGTTCLNILRSQNLYEPSQKGFFFFFFFFFPLPAPGREQGDYREECLPRLLQAP